MITLFNQKILPAVTFPGVEEVMPVTEAIHKGGLSLLEVAFRTPAAPACIQLIRKAFPEMKTGAGTILTVAQLHKAIDVGAQFGLSPGFNPTVVREAARLNFPFIPGVMTPSEMEWAFEAGCSILKLFPAAQAGGIDFLKAVEGPYGHLGLQFIPMGGVNLVNMPDYLRCKNVIAIGGSWLAATSLIRDKNYAQIEKNVQEAVQAAKG